MARDVHQACAATCAGICVYRKLCYRQHKKMLPYILQELQCLCKINTLLLFNYMSVCVSLKITTEVVHFYGSWRAINLALYLSPVRSDIIKCFVHLNRKPGLVDATLQRVVSLLKEIIAPAGILIMQLME